MESRGSAVSETAIFAKMRKILPILHDEHGDTIIIHYLTAKVNISFFEETIPSSESYFFLCV
jgi:hypothetical protein